MKRYLITDPKYYTSKPIEFKKTLQKVLQSQDVDYLCLRDKSADDYYSLATCCKKLCDDFGVSFLIHTDVALALKLGANGVHLSKKDYKNIAQAKKHNLFVIASTHSLKEALFVQKLGADAITYSPIFDTPNKGTPKGLENLKEINDKIDIHCFALGGIIEEHHIQACKDAGVYGFASIRYFLKKVSI